MIWKAYLDDNLFWSTAVNSDSVRLSDIELDLVYGEAGSTSFDVIPQNTAYGTFNRLTSMVSIRRDGEELFYGRVYGVDGEFNTIQTITCEGIMAALGDTIIEPFTFNSTLSALVLAFLEEHNAKSDIQFNLGNIEVEDDYVYRAYETYETTKSRLDDLVDSYGGYLATHRDDDGNIYLDWYEDGLGTINQTVEFGSNLANLVQESTADDLITCLYAFGATETDDDGNETTVDLSSVTDDGVLYIINEDAVAEFGKIWGTNTWEDVTDASNLYTKAVAYLNEKCQPHVTVTATAVDLADAGYDFDHFAIGYYVPVLSSPHGIDQDILCMEIIMHPLNPANGTLSLGTTIAGYTKTATANQKSTVKEINEIKANYATGDAVSAIQQTVVTNTSLIDQSSEEILALVQQIVELGESITTTAAQIELLADQIELKVSSDDLSTWITLTSEYLLIGQSGSDIHSEQDNDSYCFVDSAGNVLLRITAASGVDATTLNASEQITLKSGGVDGVQEWALRLGTLQENGHHNFNIVYVGGDD